MKSREFIKFFLFLSLLVPFYLTQTCFAATHYVSPTGSATWANSANINTPCSIATANANAAAGDLIYLRGGNYSYSQQYVLAFHPRTSGTSGSWITYKKYPTETPEFVGTYGTRMSGLTIANQSYIIVDGIIFSDFSDHNITAYAHHIEVKNCTFRNVTSPYRGGGFFIGPACIGRRASNCPTHDLWIHHNTFYKLQAGGGCNGTGISEGGDALRIGYFKGTGGHSDTGIDYHITIEDNYMAYAGHAVMDTYGQTNVFKNNVAHNEPWYPADNGHCAVAYQPVYTNAAYNGLYSHRVFQFTDTFSRQYSYNLIEGNRLGYGGVNPNNDGATSLTIASPGNIVRYNAAYGSMHNSMKTKYGDHYGWQASGGCRNRIYNNTLYHNGYGYPYFQTCTNPPNSTCPKVLLGFRFYAPADSPGNVLVNNIVYGSYGAVVHGFDDIQSNTSGSITVNNFCTHAALGKCIGYGDPKFVNPDLTQTTSLTLPNLGLQAGSGAIDAGTYLTTAKEKGTNSTTLIVADALYFQDGTWGADMTHGDSLFADWIAIGSAGNIVQISSIDYLTNTITMASPMTWSNRAPIWLYKKSDGTRVLYGSAPDMGAYEYKE